VHPLMMNNALSGEHNRPKHGHHHRQELDELNPSPLSP